MPIVCLGNSFILATACMDPGWNIFAGWSWRTNYSDISGDTTFFGDWIWRCMTLPPLLSDPCTLSNSHPPLDGILSAAPLALLTALLFCMHGNPRIAHSRPLTIHLIISYTLLATHMYTLSALYDPCFPNSWPCSLSLHQLLFIGIFISLHVYMYIHTLNCCI